MEGGDGVGCPAPASHNGCLFPDYHHYDQFMCCLHWIIDKYLNKFFALGISPGNLGLHLVRKGASSHASSKKKPAY